MQLKILIPILSIIILLGCCTQNAIIKKETSLDLSNLGSISILFPHINYYETHGEIKVLKPGHSLYVSKNVENIFLEIIGEGKYLPKTSTIITDTTIINQWIPQNFLKSIAYYDKITDSTRVSQSQTSIFPLTPELKQLVEKVDSEYFIFISGIALGASDESKKYDVMQAQIYELFYDAAFSYDYQWYSLLLNIYVVDKKSNEVVWYRYNDTRNAKYDALKKSDIKSLCIKLLK
ncbi:MAG: hypothetical protein M0R34_02675 [Candidatus Marinimicrobia bacterium]|nr:hypothetical protein [Candidatus Neomarinimicrobiota bacterium]MCK9483247.1 hypothetical protein [Candidatus Neomarinimicrobiota bacterium]MCK9559862.1 hypothetical protein [Candidatus Neomarinimicrobiota bacterium]MDD5060948.1 hypothetical protein [Candidatus Neomarinimicrobiota bacterium]MDD5229831.1 hypothetical protein [Candidatus Neomarinimicrobiota bacterium]